MRGLPLCYIRICKNSDAKPQIQLSESHLKDKRDCKDNSSTPACVSSASEEVWAAQDVGLSENRLGSRQEAPLRSTQGRAKRSFPVLTVSLTGFVLHASLFKITDVFRRLLQKFMGNRIRGLFWYRNYFNLCNFSYYAFFMNFWKTPLICI